MTTDTAPAATTSAAPPATPPATPAGARAVAPAAANRPVAPGSSAGPAARATRRLLAAGAVAGPLYVGVSLAQALTRDGFDLTRHSWSLLANGDLGSVHIANLVITGVLTTCFAAGLRRVHRGWAPRLIAAYGLSLIAAGVFRADPALGFPPGTAPGPGEVTWHGLLHLASGGIGFLCLTAACLVTARRYRHAGRTGRAAYSAITGVLFLAAFAGIASGAGGAALNLAFTGAVLLVWAWLAGHALDLRRNT
ncbi:MAG: DUF998 domain-containing protein [Streptosporangiales bacterium]|nr:DUF998 domain-containing protein [Streptosporangiales bacterium]